LIAAAACDAQPLARSSNGPTAPSLNLFVVCGVHRSELDPPIPIPRLTDKQPLTQTSKKQAIMATAEAEGDAELALLLASSLDPHPSQDSHQAARDLGGVLTARLTVRIAS